MSQKTEMSRELANEIFRLDVEESKISNRKWEIRRSLEKNSWSEVATEAMKFLLEESHVNIGQ